MNIATRSQYYSSVPQQGQDGKPKGFRLNRSLSPGSPTKRGDAGLRSNKSSASKVTTSVQMMKSTARSMIPSRFLLSPCPLSLNSPSKGRRLGQDDEKTPVIFYRDEDTVIRRVQTNELMTFVDPFAFEDRKDKVKRGTTKKKKSKLEDSVEVVCSPVSVVGHLFTVEEEHSLFDAFSDDEDEEVFFDDPFFPRSLTPAFDENTSLDISESILSINAELESFDNKDEDTCDKSPEKWFGFFNSDSYTSQEWDPELEDKSFAE